MLPTFFNKTVDACPTERMILRAYQHTRFWAINRRLSLSMVPLDVDMLIERIVDIPGVKVCCRESFILS